MFQRYGKFQRKMYFMNLMLSLTLMSILVTIIFGLIYQMSAREYQAVMDESVQNSLSNIALKSEIIAEAIKSIEKSESKDKFILAKTKGEHHLYSYLLKQELTKLSSRYLNSDFVFSVAIDDRISSVVNPYGTMQQKEFSKEFFGQEELLQIKMAELSGRGLGADITFEKEKHLRYMRYGNVENRGYFIFLDLPLEEITGFLPEVDWRLTDKDGVIAASGGVVALKEDYGVRAFQFFDKEMRWTLHISYEKRKLDVKTLLLYFLLPFVGLSLLISFASYYITQILYKPIKELVMETKNLLPEETGEDEFRVLKKGTEQVQRLSNDLLQTRSEKEKLLRIKQARDLLFGIVPAELVPENEDTLYCVAVFSLHQIPEDKRFLQKQYLKEALENCENARCVDTEDISCTMILKAESLDYAKRFINDILEKSPEDTMQMALSDPVYGLEAIKTAYLQCLLLLEYKYMYRQQRFLTADLIKVRADENYSYPLSAENSIIQGILAGREDGLIAYDRIVLQNKKIVESIPQIRHRFVLMIIGTIQRILRELYMEIPLSHELSNLEEGWQEEDIFERTRQNLRDIQKFLSSKEQKEEDDLANVMLEYIKEHYHEDIMLVDLAEKINTSEKYCSTLFKQAVGENFKTYLNSLRIEKAKEIFRQNYNAKIVDVAMQVGFNSANTFIRVFSKQEGVTPKAYLENTKRKNET